MLIDLYLCVSSSWPGRLNNVRQSASVYTQKVHICIYAFLEYSWYVFLRLEDVYHVVLRISGAPKSHHGLAGWCLFHSCGCHTQVTEHPVGSWPARDKMHGSVPRMTHNLRQFFRPGTDAFGLDRCHPCPTLSKSSPCFASL